MEKTKLDRINELARLSKERELFPIEKDEQARLRKEYIAEWRQSTISLLENTVIVNPDGTRRPLSKMKKQ
ncbi:MAG: DUF896 domain-containing protein [Oscillospiraceae bacterium]|nr:DUF896 domain-containing protein [Oscillospiraceae bacterium]